MNSRRIAFYVAVFGLFALLEIYFRVRQWRHEAHGKSFPELFEVVHVHTNDTKGIVIVERKTGNLLWGKWSFGSSNETDTVSYFFEDKNIMNVHPKVGQPLRFDISFFGEDGAVRAVWVSRDTNAGFTERTQYGEGTPRKEFWFNEAWHTVQHRTNDGKIQGGIVLDGKWQQVTFTNGTMVVGP